MHTKEEVTAVIRDLWSQVLESDELPGDIDFYAAGGSSLMSLVLVTELNEAFSTEFAIAELVDCRTIDTQSEAVWNRMTRGATARDEQAVLVPLARVREESGEQDATFVAVHDVSGDIYGYTSLAGELSGRVDLFGIKLAPERFDAPRALSIPGLASEYVAELESAFGDSRQLVILGWSLGGMVGFEMAKLLDQRQRPAARLVLIDSPYELDLPGPDDAGRGAFLPEDERKLLDEFGWLGGGEPLFPHEASVEDMWRAVRARLDAPVKERLAAEFQRRFPLMARAIPHLSSLNALEFVCYINRFRSVFQAGRSYRLTGATTAPIELLTASRSQNFDPRWSTHTQASFRRRSLDGDHFSILDRTSIRAIAQAIIISNAA
jgi:thioesterase domain-containing protein/acyl carrier protein